MRQATKKLTFTRLSMQEGGFAASAIIFARGEKLRICFRELCARAAEPRRLTIRPAEARGGAMGATGSSAETGRQRRESAKRSFLNTGQLSSHYLRYIIAGEVT